MRAHVTNWINCGSYPRATHVRSVFEIIISFVIVCNMNVIIGINSYRCIETEISCAIDSGCYPRTSERVRIFEVLIGLIIIGNMTGIIWVNDYRGKFTHQSCGINICHYPQAGSPTQTSIGSKLEIIIGLIIIRDLWHVCWIKCYRCILANITWAWKSTASSINSGCYPTTAIVCNVLQVSIGLVIIGNMDIIVGINGNGSEQANCACWVKCCNNPATTLISSILEIFICFIIIGNVSVSIGIKGDWSVEPTRSCRVKNTRWNRPPDIDRCRRRHSRVVDQIKWVRRVGNRWWNIFDCKVNQSRRWAPWIVRPNGVLCCIQRFSWSTWDDSCILIEFKPIWKCWVNWPTIDAIVVYNCIFQSSICFIIIGNVRSIIGFDNNRGVRPNIPNRIYCGDIPWTSYICCMFQISIGFVVINDEWSIIWIEINRGIKAYITSLIDGCVNPWPACISWILQIIISIVIIRDMEIIWGVNR